MQVKKTHAAKGLTEPLIKLRCKPSYPLDPVWKFGSDEPTHNNEKKQNFRLDFHEFQLTIINVIDLFASPNKKYQS